MAKVDARTDEELVAAVNDGDADAFAALYYRYRDWVVRLAWRFTGRHDDALDVLQETFLEVCRSMAGFRGSGPGRLTAWVKRVAASKALMRVRREKYRETDALVEDGPAAGRIGPDLELQLDLEAALARLPTTSRAVVWLHDVEGYTHEDIAEMMDRTVSFSKSQLARAHAKLRAWLGGE